MDLTKITTPFGLLDEATQEALMAHGGPYQVWGGISGWNDCERSLKRDPWRNSFVYRVKPAPPKPREWWAVGLHLHNSEADAQRFLAELNAEYAGMDFGQVIRVREVLE